MEWSQDRSEEGYSADWYDVNDDPIWSGNERTLTFTVPEKNGDLFLSVETYYMDMMPHACQLDQWARDFVPFYAWQTIINGEAMSY